MAERPIILFGEPTPAKKAPEDPKFSRVSLPSHSRQITRLTPKMDALKQTVLKLQSSATGIEPEMALVFELAKSEKDFYTAVRNFGDEIDIVFDLPCEYEANDDFHALKYDKRTNSSHRNDKKTGLGGKIYCMLTSTKALLNLLSLWENYRKDESMQFPRGCTGFRKVFECLLDIRRWGYRERITETGILDAWNEDLQFTKIENVRCEIEIFFSKSPDVRQRREDDVCAKVELLGGTVISRSTIAEINYHAILADLPRTVNAGA